MNSIHQGCKQPLTPHHLFPLIHSNPLYSFSSVPCYNEVSFMSVRAVDIARTAALGLVIVLFSINPHRVAAFQLRPDGYSVTGERNAIPEEITHPRVRGLHKGLLAPNP